MNRYHDHREWGMLGEQSPATVDVSASATARGVTEKEALDMTKVPHTADLAKAWAAIGTARMGFKRSARALTALTEGQRPASMGQISAAVDVVKDSHLALLDATRDYADMKARP